MKILMACLLVLSFCACAQAAEQGNLKALRNPIVMDYGASPRFAVTFRHSDHKKQKCKTCHHILDADGHRFVNCTIEQCHSTPGARDREPLSMFMAYHAKGTDRSCYGCHKMKAAKHPQFVGCRPCHMSPMTRKAIAEKKAAEAKQ